ncbi:MULTISPECIES: hypothetical protein [Halobacteriovorax]|uniref:Uncharacterized protein n=1 Tax=Halobacteriovorax vibrionivorans TaxID=2152716 RepID=A0ABY0IK70_9BACT|nr:MULTISPECIES: hypothetical protein [Halobacteriovorax]RZF21954.1 hypothetical protein DAY19_09715 [Halobacteriovorax vibrionivorans]TGD47204.1 hypothetical protein EP118_08805 [Halobacteriovorax sp. Y22]
MKFGKFSIISQRDVQALGDTCEPIYINYDHIVSMKPINIVIDGEVQEGYWIRLSNGKKYRAIEIPAKFKESMVH